MITAHHISKSYSINQILSDVSFSVNSGERAGLIGPNGCGKTTLLKILAGLERADSGAITRNPSNLKIGHLPQGHQYDDRLSLTDLLRQHVGNPRQAEEELSSLATALAADPEDLDLQNAYAQTLARIEQYDPSGEHRFTEALDAFGLGDLPQELPLSYLSGGQKTRLGLALLILREPDLLLLDEPTNHLDINMLEWLETWLSEFAGAALIVSHDRTFLDNSVTKILDLDPETHSLHEYPGNYSDYLEQFLLALEKQEAAYRDQEYEIRRLKQDINRTKQQSLRVEMTTTSRQPTVRRYAKKVARKAKSREKKLERYLQSDERLERPSQSWQMKLEFTRSGHQSQEALTCDNLTVGYDKNNPLITNLNLAVKTQSRIALTGINGSGKTTLLRTLSGSIEPLHGKYQLGATVKLGYMSQEQETLDPKENALEVIQRQAPFSQTEARAFLHFFLFSDDDPLRPLESLSFGERARLALAELVAAGCNLLLLDEPINHLDIPSRERFEQALAQFGGTIIAVVHDRYFINRFATELWVLENRAIRRELLLS